METKEELKNMEKKVYIVIEGSYDVPFNIKAVFSTKSKAEEYVNQTSTYSTMPLYITSEEVDPYIHKYKSAYVVFSKDGQKIVKVSTFQSERATTIQKVNDGYGVEIPMQFGDTTQDAVKKAEEVINYVLTHRSEFPLIETMCVEESYLADDGYDENHHSRVCTTKRTLLPIYNFDTKEIILGNNKRIIEKI